MVRDEWGFDGFIQSDAGAVALIKGRNNTVKATIALKAGVDQDLDGGEYSGLAQAVELGWVTEGELDVALGRVFKERIRTGQLDPPELVPYSQYDLSVVDLPASRESARQAAREGTVLLKHEGGLLPINLNSTALRSIAVIGPNADRLYTLLGVRPLPHPHTPPTPSTPSPLPTHLPLFPPLSPSPLHPHLRAVRTTTAAPTATVRTLPLTPAACSSPPSPPSARPSPPPTPRVTRPPPSR